MVNPLLIAVGSMAVISNFWLLRERNGLKVRMQRELDNEKSKVALYKTQLKEVSQELEDLKLREQFEKGVKIGRKSDFLWQELKQQIEGEENSAIIHFTHRKGEKE